MAGFSSRHGEVRASPTPDGISLVAADGATADVVLSFLPFDPAAAGPTLDALVAAAARHACTPRRVAVLLARRGGYACATVTGPSVAGSKVGSRYVQGRTAAGGWSQQRFARRREKQAHELEKAVVAVAERVLVSGPVAPQWLSTGGDRALVDAILSDPRLARLTALPRGPHLAVGDPDGRLVAGLPLLLQKVTIRVSDPATPASATPAGH